MLEDETSTVLCAGLGTPGVTVTVGIVVVTADPLSVAEIDRAVPAVVPVNTALYVPFALSVTAPNVPALVPPPDPERLNATFAPPVVRFAPAASLACSSTVAVLPDRMLADETEIVDVVAEATGVW